MKTYRTSEIAQFAGIHPNTLRLYEEIGFITKPERRANGYRVFTDLHKDQIICVRIALRVELLQNGLRTQALRIIKTVASGDIQRAIRMGEAYQHQIAREQQHAEEAIAVTEELLSIGNSRQEPPALALTRKQVSDYLGITVDTLRNWELNGLVKIKRRSNGYRVYHDDDIRLLKIIRSLRCANYSLASILRMLNTLTDYSRAHIRQVIDTPREDDDIISVCDHLISSLHLAAGQARLLLDHLRDMEKKYER